MDRARRLLAVLLATGVTVLGSGCASMRRLQPDPDLRPSTDGFTTTADGWELGIRHYPARNPDPEKLPVILSHGLGLNATFWTITPNHLAQQLAERGYEVFLYDARGSGESHLIGPVGWVNSGLRQTFLPEIGSRDWTMDDQSFYDVPAVIDYVVAQTGKPQVNWVGHSLGGMLMFGFLERSPHAPKVANFVAMGSPACIVDTPERIQMLRANRGLRLLLRAISTGRIARPMAIARPSKLEKVDRFYYTAENVDNETISRFYAFTLEDPGPGALQQLDKYLDSGRLVSADGSFDYYEHLGEITTPTLFIAGDGDILADLESKWRTFQRLGSSDKTFLRFGTREGHVHDYGHCDLVWSRHAPAEIFPEIIDWLDARQGRELASPQSPVAVSGRSSASMQKRDQVSNRSRSATIRSSSTKPAS